MKYSMRHAVYEEMLGTMKHAPRSFQELIYYASENEKAASLTPFYGFYLYPYEWMDYSLQNDDLLIAEMNAAMLIALDAPTIQAESHMIHFFSTAASSNNNEASKQSLSVALRTTMLFQMFAHLQNKVAYFADDHQFSMRKYKALLREAVMIH